MPDPDTHFARIVSLACHDLRTPLATVHGFARTLATLEDVSPTAQRYLGIMAEASVQLTDLLEELALAARIEGRRWEPNLQEVELGELLAESTERIDVGTVAASGSGGTVRVDADATRRALQGLARCALRHGGLTELEATLGGPTVSFRPVTGEVTSIILGEDLRDLGAAVGVRAVRAQGGSVDADGETLVVRLPAA
jgi:signal transduction histidine kinase